MGPDPERGVVSSTVEVVLVDVEMQDHGGVRNEGCEGLEGVIEQVDLAVAGAHCQEVPGDAHGDDGELQLGVVPAHQFPGVQVCLHDLALLRPQEHPCLGRNHCSHARAAGDVDGGSVVEVVDWLRDDPACGGGEEEVDLARVGDGLCGCEPAVEVCDVAVEREGELREQLVLLEHHVPGQEGDAQVDLVALGVVGQSDGLQRLCGHVQDAHLADGGVGRETQQPHLVGRGLVGEPGAGAVVGVALVQRHRRQLALVQIHQGYNSTPPTLRMHRCSTPDAISPVCAYGYYCVELLLLMCGMYVWQCELSDNQMVEPSNNAIEIFREGTGFRSTQAEGFVTSTRCLSLASALSRCVLSKGLNVLDHQAVRENCEVEEWRAECPGIVRRHQFERLYRKTLNRRLYNQHQLDQYMHAKNNNIHFGIVDHRY